LGGFLKYFYQQSAIPGVNNIAKDVSKGNLGGALNEAKSPLRWNQIYQLGRGAEAQFEAFLESLLIELGQLAGNAPPP
jgi:hypothetical protein